MPLSLPAPWGCYLELRETQGLRPCHGVLGGCWNLVSVPPVDIHPLDISQEPPSPPLLTQALWALGKEEEGGGPGPLLHLAWLNYQQDLGAL